MFDYSGNAKDYYKEVPDREENGNPTGKTDQKNMSDHMNMMNPIGFMQQAFFMHLQFMQNMTAMQMLFMQNMMRGMNFDMPMADTESTQTVQTEGFKLGDVTVPPELLKKLMHMDMSPENLEKLQNVLDFVLGSVPEKKE